MTAGLNHFIVLSAVLFGLGIYTVIAHKNIVKSMAGIIMIFVSSIINLAAFSGFKNFNQEGQVILFITASVCILNILIGTVLSYNYYKKTKSTSLGND